MYTLFVVVVYFIMMVLLLGSKLKTTWIIWVSFFVGFSLAHYQNIVEPFLLSIL